MGKKVNWGVIGLGNIAMNFAKASQLTDNAILKGIASKNKKKISNFKELFDVKSEHCFDNYEDLINCSEIEAIYIALPNSCLLYTSPSPRDGLLSRMPSSA